MPYIQFAKDLCVHIVQLPEPKNIGCYAEKEVLLEETHIRQLGHSFRCNNKDGQYKDFPFVMYYRFHQRRAGYYAGSRSQMPLKENSCPRFGKIA